MSMILIIMLSGSVLSTTLFGNSDASIPKRPPEVDPNTLANVGVRGYSGGIACVNTTVPSAVPSTSIAVAQQTKDILAGLTIGKDGIQGLQNGILLALLQKESSRLERI